MTIDYRPPVPELTGVFQFLAPAPCHDGDCLWTATAAGEVPQCGCELEETA